MKIRFKVAISGTFMNREGQPPYGISVNRGDILDVPDIHALPLIASGKAEVRLDGPLGRPWQLSMPENEFAALKAKIEGKVAPPPPPPEPARKKTRAERDALRAAIPW